MRFTHTIRNKAKDTPILTLSPAFLQKALAAHPEAFNLMLAWFQKEYKSLTGKTPVLDYEQRRALLDKVGADQSGHWTSQFTKLDAQSFKLLHIFQSGMLSYPGLSVDEVLNMANQFYEMSTKLLPCNAAAAATPDAEALPATKPATTTKSST